MTDETTCPGKSGGMFGGMSPHLFDRVVAISARCALWLNPSVSASAALYWPSKITRKRLKSWSFGARLIRSCPPLLVDKLRVHGWEDAWGA